MARSDNTAWYSGAATGQRGLAAKWATFSMPSGTGRYLRRRWQKQQRQRGREALRRGEQPDPVRTRHGVQRDYW